jgi:hypothetical protein
MRQCSFELAVVDQPRTGLSQRGDGSNRRSGRAERRCSARFVMVLDEPYEVVLVLVVG